MLNCFFNVIKQLLQFFALCLGGLGELLAFWGIGQRATWALVEILDFLAQFFLLLGQVTGFSTHLFHLLRKLVRCLFTEFIAHLLQIFLRLGAV